MLLWNLPLQTVQWQVALYKDAESELTSKIYDFRLFTEKLSCIKMPSQNWRRKFMTFGPHRRSEETYLTFSRADDSFRQLGRHVWCLPVLAIMNEKKKIPSSNLVWCVAIWSTSCSFNEDSPSITWLRLVWCWQSNVKCFEDIINILL